MFQQGMVTPPLASGQALRLDAVTRHYESPGGTVRALNGVSLALDGGSFTAVMGPSGSGKSTLLQCAAGLDTPTSGRVLVDGVEMSGGTEAELTRFRRNRIGFVFQHFNLLPTLTVLQNATLPLRLAGKRVDRTQAVEVLTRVGLADRLDHLPAQLSGGQQQRVAIARALVAGPRVVFADEPTGALDTRSARQVLALLQEAVRIDGRTLVMVTHDPVAAAHADQVLFLADGRLVGRLAEPTAAAVADAMTRLTDQAARGRVAEGV
ncbi:ABC transporter ATP-binding protein [Actinomadura craniellae]|uniref:ABC transporter ATP-binding protein n=1 Tax=Actinomadura craniellae TaxID=2231787 RepID=A0A365H904_9ACTN|nr:ABC transporter ATP-binding protein [Actinomadura craniellae]RAY15561.1 ABC transporter ATP-binding protein [Actinomadura craniellae]